MRKSSTRLVFVVVLTGLILAVWALTMFGEWSRPRFDSVAEFYDGRQMVFIASVDDFADHKIVNATWVANNFTERQIVLSGGIITGATNSTTWDTLQGFLDAGYFEAAAHSRTHPNIPYSDYAHQIVGSKNDIVGNLTLPGIYRDGKGREFLWGWIGPYGESDSSQRSACGDALYLSDRNTTRGLEDWAEWDPENGLYGNAGVTRRVEDNWAGEDDVDVLNAAFDSVYGSGGVYHIFTHPSGNMTALLGHLDYVKRNHSVWYSGLGAAYAYHYVQERAITRVSRHEESGSGTWFEISVPPSDHANYGLTYPVTYVFDLKKSWNSGYGAQVRHNASESWSDLVTRLDTDIFNGIECVRFDYADHRAYVSVAFDAWNDEIHIRFQETGEP